MSLISLIVTLLVIGVLMWLFETYIPLDATIKRIIHAIIIIVVVLWLLQVFGVLGHVQDVRVGPIR